MTMTDELVSHAPSRSAQSANPAPNAADFGAALSFDRSKPGRTRRHPAAGRRAAGGAAGRGACCADDLRLPEMAQNDVIRYFVGLSRLNYSIDTGFYPLGSCTMKYNPKINEDIARLPGFAQALPQQPEETVQGALAVLYELQDVARRDHRHGRRQPGAGGRRAGRAVRHPDDQGVSPRARRHDGARRCWCRTRRTARTRRRRRWPASRWSRCRRTRTATRTSTSWRRTSTRPSPR